MKVCIFVDSRFACWQMVTYYPGLHTCTVPAQANSKSSLPHFFSGLNLNVSNPVKWCFLLSTFYCYSLTFPPPLFFFWAAQLCSNHPQAWVKAKCKGNGWACFLHSLPWGWDISDDLWVVQALQGTDLESLLPTGNQNQAGSTYLIKKPMNKRRAYTHTKTCSDPDTGKHRPTIQGWKYRGTFTLVTGAKCFYVYIIISATLVKVLI